MTSTPEALTLSQLNRRIVEAVTYSPGVQNVWVVAETSDMHISRGHCYLELVEKDADTGKPVAKLSANIWQDAFYRLSAKFMHETGQQLRSDLKVMVFGSVNYHPIYGLKFNITDINGAYTLGDVMRLRLQILQRLQNEGIISNNQELPWCAVPQRIAIISAAGAAGYGDFMKHLYGNPHRLRFTTKLFPAAMQGEYTAPSVIAALEAIAAEAECWDCVVIIRGGGATSDLLSFDNYDLAANVAMFPLPVITGIGHDRDRTVLAYVSKVDVKTPTDAAQVLISLGEQQLARIHDLASGIHRAVTMHLASSQKHLAYIAGALPSAATNAITRARAHIEKAHVVIASASERHIQPERIKLQSKASTLIQAIDYTLRKEHMHLDADQKLLDVLSPQATLNRGYSITRVNCHAITSADVLTDGAVVETILAKGSFKTTYNTH